MASTSSTELVERVQALPQELQDTILDYTLALPSGPVFLTKHYRPPLGLSINRSIRAKTAASFYAERIFRFQDSGKISQELCYKWLCSISIEHEKLLSSSFLDVPTRPNIVTWFWNGVISKACPTILGFVVDCSFPDVVRWRIVVEDEPLSERFIARLVT